MFKTQTVNLAVWGWQTKFIVNNSLAEAINLYFDTRKFSENSACLRCAVVSSYGDFYLALASSTNTVLSVWIGGLLKKVGRRVEVIFLHACA